MSADSPRPQGHAPFEAVDSRVVGATFGGRYVVERVIGQGGMAAVYLALDNRHNRSVALKLLRPELRESVGAQRFLREVQMTARLMHPHILPLLDSGEMNGVLYYVMPHVQGDSLRSYLKRERQLPIAESVRIACEVAEALHFAHGAGIVHRDIKPENILLQDGRAVVADFGIARAVSRAAGDSLTATGLSVGTPSYMSPEQASGEPEIDGRSDIYALGCVLHEMISGEPPFVGPTAQAVIAKTLSLEPVPLRRLRPAAPAAVEQAVLRALAKVPSDRFQTAEEFIKELERVGSPMPASLHSAERPHIRVIRAFRARLPVAAGLLVLFGWGIASVLRKEPASLVAESVVQLTHQPALEFDASLSPDGRFVAYATGGSGQPQTIEVRPVGEGRAVRLTDADFILPRRPRWSPEGGHIAFETRDGIFIVPALGGVPRRVVPGNPIAHVVRGPAWSPDGRSLAYAADSGIRVRDLASEKVRKVTHTVEPIGQLSWSPDGEWLAYVSGNRAGIDNASASSIRIVRARGGAAITLTDSVTAHLSPAWMPDSKTLLFVSGRGGGRDIYWIRLDRNGVGQFSPKRLTTGLSVASLDVSVSGDRIAYTTMRTISSIWYANRAGSRGGSFIDEQPLLQRDESIGGLALSNNGRWLIFDSNFSGNQDLYKIPVTGGIPERFTHDQADDWHGDWSPDDTEIAFYSVRNGTRHIYVMNADGSSERQVTFEAGQDALPDWSPDGKSIAYSNNEARLLIIDRQSNGTFGPPRQFTDFKAIKPRWSAKGDSIALVAVGAAPSIRVVDLNGNGRTVMTAPMGLNPWNVHTEWSKTGRLHVGFGGPDGATISADPGSGRASQSLLPFTDLGLPFALSPDERAIYFKRSRRESEVWLLTLAQR